MAESRRVELVSSTPLVDDKKKEEKLSTVRLTVSLTESNDTSCPEFSYTDMLLQNAPNDPSVDLDSNDPFSAKDKMEHDKLLAIGRAFEAKYATKPGKRKNSNGRRKLDVRDLVDLGDGYDETDNFIDNTEAYDEYVPKTLTTKFGGFYINIGMLDFREVSDNEDVENGTDELNDLIPRKKKFKRHLVLSDSEDPNPDRKERKKKHKHLKENGTEEKVMKKKKRLNCNIMGGEKIRKRPPGRPPKMEKRRLISELLGAGDNPDSAAVRLDLERDISVLKPTSENVLQQSDKKPLLETTSVMAATSVDKISVISVAASGSGDLPQASAATSLVDKNVESEKESCLPASLPPRLYGVIDELKLAAKQTSEGRLFTTEVNRLLLQIEMECRQLPNSMKAHVFLYLSKAMRCEKEFLIKRSKKLILAHFDEKLKKPISLLREAVTKVMPALIERHRSDVSAIEQLRRERINESGKDSTRRDVAESGKESARRDGGTGSDSDENCLEDNAEATTPSNGERQKRIMAPRKKFEWTLEMRTILNSIVTIKMEQFETSKIRSQTAEEYLKSFFEAELKMLWPAGWMQARMLFKESREAHLKWTSGILKPKKLMQVAGTMPGSKTSTPAGQEFRENHKPAPSPCVTPIIKSEMRLTATKREMPLHNDIVVLDDSLSTSRGIAKPENVKDSRQDLSHDHSRKVSFCPNIHVVQLPSDSQSQSSDSRRLQARCENGNNIMAGKLEDSIELCRGSLKSETYNNFLCDPSEKIADNCSKPRSVLNNERISRTSPPLDAPSCPVVGSSLTVEADKFATESCSSLNLFCESYVTGAVQSVGSQLNPASSTFGDKFTEFLEHSGPTNKVKPRGYHLKEPTIAAQCLAVSASSAERLLKSLKDSTDRGILDSRVYSREYCDKVRTSPVKNCLQSTMIHSANMVGPFDCSQSPLMASPTKNTARPAATLRAVSAVRTGAKHLDSTSSRAELTASNFISSTCVTSADVQPIVRSSCSRSPASSAVRPHATFASTSDARDMQNPTAWFPWSEWNPGQDLTSREHLVQSLINDSIEQRRKAVMSTMGKLSSMPSDSGRPSGVMTGELHKTMAKSCNVPSGSIMTQHSRPSDYRQPSQVASSTSPNVSPQQQSLLLSQQQISGQFLMGPAAQLKLSDYQPGSSSAAVRASEMIEVSGQCQPSMAAAIVSSSTKNYGRPSQVVGGNGKASFTSLSHQLSADMGFPATERHSSGSHAINSNSFAGVSSAGTLSAISTSDISGMTSNADVGQNCSLPFFRTNPMYAMHHVNDVTHTSPQ